MSPRPGELEGRIWPRAAYAYGALLALGLGYFLIRMPYQVSDDLEHLLIAQSQSARELLVTRYSTAESMRPLMWLTQKAVFDLAPSGRYFTTYKAVHVAQLIVLVILFIRLLRVRTAIDLMVVPLALVVLAGMHTFNITMREGYPVNHFMSILVCCLLVVNL